MPAIGWFCTYTPEELILAAGLESRRILGRPGNSVRADSYLHPNLCAYVRACCGSLIEGTHSDLAGVVGVDSCDAMRRLFDVCQRFLSFTFSHTLALPHARHVEAVDFYESEVRKLAGVLGIAFGGEIGEERLAQAILVLNETRTLLGELDKLRRESSCLPDVRYYEILLQAMTAPKREFNRTCRRLLEDSRAAAARPREAIKLVLSGGILDDVWLIEAIERAGGFVAADDLCCGSRYFEGLVETGGDPLRRIAERYMGRAPCARMNATEARIERLLGLIGKTGARGLIYYSIKFCDPHLLDWAMINQELQREGIPALRCEADYSTASREQMRTRIEAFLEMLK